MKTATPLELTSPGPVNLKLKALEICPDRTEGLAVTEIMLREALYEYLDHLHGAYVLNELWLPGTGTRFKRKPGKLFFENGSLLTLLANANVPAFVGALRETFVVNQLRNATDLKLSPSADFQDATDTHFEVGGASKNRAQLPEDRNGFILVDDMEVGSGHRIPLYLIGFLY